MEQSCYPRVKIKNNDKSIFFLKKKAFEESIFFFRNFMQRLSVYQTTF